MLITHEHDVAARAGRRPSSATARSATVGAAMSWAETLRPRSTPSRTHRLRSALTMLGILIGIASVILTVGLGQGAQAEVRDQIDALGSNLLVVSPGSTHRRRPACGAASAPRRP